MAKEWKSWMLRPWYLAILILTNIGFIAAIIGLTIASSKYKGFATVSETDISSWGDFSWNNLKSSQFRWTFVPTLLINLFSVSFTVMVSSSEERQPYVALNRNPADAKTVKDTVLLDYPATLALYRWCKAFARGHLHLGFGMLLGLTTSIALVPLSSNLFQTKPLPSESFVTLSYLGAVDIAARLVANDLQPALDVASAVLVHGSSPPSWMTEKYAFTSFDLPKNLNGSSGNVTVNTLAFWVDPQCRHVPQSELHAQIRPASDAEVTELLLDYTDRGCNIINQGTTYGNFTRGFSTMLYQRCHSFSNDTIGTISGSPGSDEQIGDLTVISCNPAYKKSSASVVVSMDPHSSPRIISVAARNSSSLGDSENFGGLHSNLTKYGTFDGSGRFRSDAFGKATFYYAQKLKPSSEVDANVMLNATTSMYQTFFANLASSQLIQPLQTPQLVQGTFAVHVVRLYVVAPTAYAMLGILFCMLLSSIWLSIYASTKRSILLEEPIGLLGKAAVLRGGNVMSWIDRFFRAHGDDIQDTEWSMIKFLEKNYTFKPSRCYYAKGPNADRVTGIIIEGYEEKSSRPSKY